MDLKKAITFHKEKRKIDSNCIMTVVMKEVQKSSGLKPVIDDLIVGFNRNSAQLLMFENSYKKGAVEIPLQIMTEHPGIVFRTDLVDSHIDICSPELMLQFSDNFDYQDIRKDFIKNEVVNWELGMHIYGYILNKEYAACIHDPRAYAAVSHDIISRWVFPFVPDTPLLHDTNYQHLKNNVYKESRVRIARSSKIGSCVVLGSGSIIDEDIYINKSVVGRNCVIGSGSNIINSFLFSDVRIESNVELNQVIVCDNATIKKGAKIGRGSIISYGVIIGEGAIIPDYTRVSLRNCMDEELGNDEDNNWSGISIKNKKNKDLTEDPYDHEVIGIDGIGYVWDSINKNGDDDDEEEDDESDLAEDYVLNDGGRNFKLDNNRANSIGCKEEVAWRRSIWRSHKPPIESPDSDDESFEEDPEKEEEKFREIVGDIILTGRSEGHPPDNLLMEIKGYKFAQNKTFADCLKAIVPALLNIVKGNQDVTLSQIELIKTLQGLFKVNGWGYVICKALIQNVNDELVMIESIENHVLLDINKLDLYPIFRFFLQICYDSELLSEESLTEWIEIRQNDEDLFNKKSLLFQEPQVVQFVEWIQESDDEDSDDEESDEEDE